jgi:predicted permease
LANVQLTGASRPGIAFAFAPDMFSDLRYGARSLARNPLFTAGAIITLALGIGVNSTIFTLVNSTLFRPLPGIRDPGRLVWLSTTWRDAARQSGLSYPDYTDFRDASTDVFAGTLAFGTTPLSIASGAAPERIRGHFVTGSYFEVLGVAPAVGRLIDTADDRRGAARPVAVLSFALWQRWFGGSPDVLQQTISVNGRSFAVVGVAPRHFSGPALGESADAWIPSSLWPELRASERNLLDDRGSSWLLAMGRLRPGTSVRRAQTVLGAVAARLEQTYPDSHRNRLVSVSSAGSAMTPQGRSELVPLSALLLTTTALVLLIACANIANLLLARGTARAAEISLRTAIGASRGRLIRQLLTENSLLAGVGAAAGLLLSFWASDLLVVLMAGSDLQGLIPTSDTRVLLFTAALTVASVCAFGLAPAFAATRRSLLPMLRQTMTATGARSRLQGAFVVAQLSLSLVLLLGAGLSVRALHHAALLDLGFDPHGVLTTSYDLVLQNYDPARRQAFRRELLARVRALPGVTAASLANLAPLNGTMIGTAVTDVDRPDAQRQTYVNAVGADYFGTLPIPILRGRGIAASDAPGAPQVVVVNQTLADRLWDGDPIGRGVRIGNNKNLFTVVGVARDAKYDESTEDPRPFLYTSLAQQPQLDRETILVRLSAGTAPIVPVIRGIFQQLDPTMPLFEVQYLEAGLEQRADKQRTISALVAAFGVLALLLAAVGVYGVMAYTVSVRRREMGVRLALGARPAQLTALIARDGLRLALIGVAIGSALAWPLASALGALVFGIGIVDVATFTGTCALLVCVALGSAALPALRAGRMDPMSALRTE